MEKVRRFRPWGVGEGGLQLPERSATCSRHGVVPFLLGLVLLPSTAHAYIDPGTGSVILQGMTAGLIALAVFWRRVLNLVRKLFSRRDGRE